MKAIDAAKLAIRRLGRHTVDEAEFMRSVYARMLIAGNPALLPKLPEIAKNMLLPTTTPPHDDVTRVLNAYIQVTLLEGRLPYIKKGQFERGEIPQFIASRYGTSLVPHESMTRRILKREGLPLNKRGQPKKSKRQK
jgi:hypothetical protein